jgi:hypothetical protein
MQNARDLIWALGWYGNGTGLRLGFIGILALSGFGGLLLLHRAARTLDVGVRLTIFGLLLLTLYIVLRASLFYELHQQFDVSPAILQMAWPMELGGIGLIAAGAWRRVNT